MGEIVIALVVGSVFYGTPETSDAFFSYGSVLLLIVRKQASYAFYRPSAEALASVLVNIPVKLVVVTCFNVILYFLSGLASTASQFFIIFVFVFVTTSFTVLCLLLHPCRHVRTYGGCTLARRNDIRPCGDDPALDDDLICRRVPDPHSSARLLDFHVPRLADDVSCWRCRYLRSFRGPSRLFPAELAVFQPLTDETYGAYIQPYLEQAAPGTLLNPDATTGYSCCPLAYVN
ncbi:hypothetical protein FOBRF1_007416 [Fusarium oxysporum]